MFKKCFQQIEFLNQKLSFDTLWNVGVENRFARWQQTIFACVAAILSPLREFQLRSMCWVWLGVPKLKIALEVLTTIVRTYHRDM